MYVVHNFRNLKEKCNSLRARNKHMDFIVDSKKLKFQARIRILWDSTKEKKKNRKRKQPKQSVASTTKDLVFHDFLRTYHNVYLHYPNATALWKSVMTKPTGPAPLYAKRRGVIAFPFRAFPLPFKIAAIRPQRLAICRGSPPDWIPPFTNYASSDRRRTETSCSRGPKRPRHLAIALNDRATARTRKSFHSCVTFFEEIGTLSRISAKGRQQRKCKNTN